MQTMEPTKKRRKENEIAYRTRILGFEAHSFGLALHTKSGGKWIRSEDKKAITKHGITETRLNTINKGADNGSK